MAKKDWENTGKLSKFDYNIGKRFLLFFVLILIGLVLGGFSIYFLITDKDELLWIFYGLMLFFLIGAFSLYLFPKTIIEIFADNGGNTVLALECWNVDDTTKYKGSAIMLKSGILVTNAHVILDEEQKVCDEIYIDFLAKGCVGVARRKAVVLKCDAELDIAVLGEIPTIRFGSTKNSAIKRGSVKSLKTGDKIYSIGNPCGNGVAISQGSVSLPLVKDKDGNGEYFIQLNIPMIGGNSGGAVLDKKGRLVGMMTYHKVANPNFGYAIPVERIIEYIEE